MVLLGTLINAVLIVVGTLIGRALRNIPEKMKETVMYAIGLAVVVLGLQMGFESQNFIVVIISLVLGAVIGEWMNLDDKLNNFGHWLEDVMGAKKESKGSIAQGFVTATLIFVIGAMGIIGALESGLSNEHGVLISKGLIDGFTSIILASTLGIGVMLAAIPVFVYQGLIALFATQISLIIPDAALDMFITEMTATGGVMIVAIGLNMIGLTKIRVANLLPGVLVVGLIVTVIYKMNLG
ncbi:DUF554 domain-containing protein [Planococcus liqunii]|uniref:DUF554 domain-containing protein n=1 Tax=Planococcus liqunii TaxID=3058394 RepID=A0ABT8MUK8_9BACL|nr:MULTISPECIES: DUF554 domain-containing protein [unclassified Planococcus (in: firmicutes)]MDN7228549.1 DUF554 domain-containing protein [Planococcus sp. N064]WKA51047.1 DUF554 domain-containing protein [Planococcus sp. N056]